MNEKNMFPSTINAIKEDPSCIYFVELAVKIGPNSILHCPTFAENVQFMIHTDS